MSATAILRFWTLVLAAYLFLEQQRAALRQTRAHHVTIGEARCEVQRIHRRHLIDWMYVQFQTGLAPQDLYEQLAA